MGIETALAELEIEYKDPAGLKGYERNAKKHPPEQLAALRRSMETFGNYAPILLRDDGVSIGAGHGRQGAALLSPPLPKVPTITLRGLTDEQWRALIVWDNRSSELGTWDNAMLRLELSGLKSEGFDLSLTGFGTPDLARLFATYDGPKDPDAEPEEQPPATAQVGDVWRCGEHWLVCGDATDPAVVAKALGGAAPVLCVSDQPYGTNYKAGRREAHMGDGFRRAKGDVQNDTRADWREAWALFPGDVIYVWHNPLEAATVAASLEVNGFDLRAQIIWRKVQPVVGPPKAHYRWQHEAAVYGVRQGKNAHWTGSKKESTVWEADRPKRGSLQNDTGHATQKPVELWKRAIENHTEPGEHLYDPFAGSGVCMIAAQMTKRVAHSIEIDPGHVDRCLARFATFTGLAPILAETGETLEQVKARRAEPE